MNLQNILNDIEKVDADVYERLDHVSRRHVFQGFMKKAMAGVAPLAFASILNKTYAQNNAVVEVLNFALTLEYLEAEFYNLSIARAGLIPGPARPYYDQIAKHENAHVVLLRSALGSAAVSKPTFDFTQRGAIPTVFTDVQTNYLVAQALEDTGVRAYKGQATRLIPFNDVLTIALQIHSVEARHAARIRYLRGLKGWITFDQSPAPLVAAVYAGDGATSQAGVNLLTLPGIASLNIAGDRISEAFDEPLTREQVLAIAGPFIVG